MRKWVYAILIILIFLFGLLPGSPLTKSVDAISMAKSEVADGVSRSSAFCPALPAAVGEIVSVSTVGELVNAVNTAEAGETILIADGFYALNGQYLRIDVPGVTLRSASGNREAVILDGHYQTTEIVQIVASNITIADLTLQKARNHPIHVMNASDGDVTGTLIYNVHIIDPGQQAIKINPSPAQNAVYFPDDGEIACSHIELTDAGRDYVTSVSSCYTGGVDAHQAQGWTIRDNLIEGFWCEAGLSEHAIHMWRSCKDTIILRNDLRNNARGVGLGLVTTGSGYRTYPGFTCPDAAGYVDDYGGTVVNNVISVFDPDLFASTYGFDCGICFWNACDSKAYHNTIYTANKGATFSSIEWRFSNTTAEIYNNLTNDVLRERENATGLTGGNLSTADASWFVNPTAYDFHLQLTATAAINQGMNLPAVTVDFEGDPRPFDGAYDIGADEVFIFTPTDWLFVPFIGR